MVCPQFVPHKIAILRTRSGYSESINSSERALVIKAVLFDMDGTLLNLNFSAFIATYAADMSRLLGEVARCNPAPLGVAGARSYLAMTKENRTDELLNGEVFVRTFEKLTGIPLADPAIHAVMDCYEQEVLPNRNTSFVHAKPASGGRAAIECAKDMGLVVALATNPAFTEACIHARMGWAEIEDADFAFISHTRNCTRLKPHAAYYQQFCDRLGVAPEECLMVGNDATKDLCRPSLGMPVAYVGKRPTRRAQWTGTMSELARELPALIGRLNDGMNKTLGA